MATHDVTRSAELRYRCRRRRLGACALRSLVAASPRYLTRAWPVGWLNGVPGSTSQCELGHIESRVGPCTMSVARETFRERERDKNRRQPPSNCFTGGSPECQASKTSETEPFGYQNASSRTTTPDNCRLCTNSMITAKSNVNKLKPRFAMLNIGFALHIHR